MITMASIPIGYSQHSSSVFFCSPALVICFCGLNFILNGNRKLTKRTKLAVQKIFRHKQNFLDRLVMGHITTFAMLASNLLRKIKINKTVRTKQNLASALGIQK